MTDEGVIKVKKTFRNLNKILKKKLQKVLHLYMYGLLHACLTTSTTNRCVGPWTEVPKRTLAASDRINIERIGQTDRQTDRCFTLTTVDTTS